VKLFELAYACRLYRQIGTDKYCEKLRESTGGKVNLQKAEHREALLEWLNSWGCRIEYSPAARNALRAWWRASSECLPSEDASLTDMSDDHLKRLTGSIATTFGDLCKRPASARRKFGATATAKALFALRPHTLPPWDNAICDKLGYDGTGESYREFLKHAQEQLRELIEDASAHGIAAIDIPASVGRPRSSFPKLVDEFYWITITRRCEPPGRAEMKRWRNWLEGSSV